MIASKSPIAIQGTKENLNYSRDHTVSEGLYYMVCDGYYRQPLVARCPTCSQHGEVEIVSRASWRFSLFFWGGGGEIGYIWGGGEHSVEDHYHHINGILWGGSQFFLGGGGGGDSPQNRPPGSPGLVILTNFHNPCCIIIWTLRFG